LRESVPAPVLERRAEEAAALLPDLLTAAEELANIVTAGHHPRRKAGRSDTFWQFRDYAHGDPIGSIDWRQSARLDGRLLVRQTEWEQPRTILLWCGGGEDFDYGERPRDSKRFRGQILTLALGVLALRAGERVGLLGGAEPPKPGLQHTTDLAFGLLRHEWPLTDLTPSPGSTAILVSDFHQPPEDLAALFAQVRHGRGHALAIAVEDPSEAAFAFEGATKIEGPRGEFRRTFGDIAAIREEYLKARSDHHAALLRAVGSAQETVLFHTTDEAPLTVLRTAAERLDREGAPR
jgi:MoxR-like ATPase